MTSIIARFYMRLPWGEGGWGRKEGVGRHGGQPLCG